MNQEIISAIEQKRVLKLHYNNFDRLVEPYTYGLNHQGVAKLRCFQLSGGRVSTASSGWEKLYVGDIVALEVTDIHFIGTRPGYTLDDPTMLMIYAQVQLRGLADWRG